MQSGGLISFLTRQTFPQTVGHSSISYQAEVGVFDYIIGHQCQGWDVWQLTLHELCGMSLRGLVQTAPAGFILFSFGYGVEYMLSGVLMGAIYLAGWAIPFPAGPFGQGSNLAEVLWGFWTWGVLLYVILASRKRPYSTPSRTIHGRKTSFLRKIVFYFFLAVVDSIFIAACATYGKTQQSSTPKNRKKPRSTTTFSLIQVNYFDRYD